MVLQSSSATARSAERSTFNPNCISEGVDDYGIAYWSEMGVPTPDGTWKVVLDKFEKYAVIPRETYPSCPAGLVGAC